MSESLGYITTHQDKLRNRNIDPHTAAGTACTEGVDGMRRLPGWTRSQTVLESVSETGRERLRERLRVSQRLVESVVLESVSERLRDRL